MVLFCPFKILVNCWTNLELSLGFRSSSVNFNNYLHLRQLSTSVRISSFTKMKRIMKGIADPIKKMKAPSPEKLSPAILC